jgi:hypothetical protein
MRIVILLLCTASWVFTSAETAQRKQPDSLIERACAGESAAVTEAMENLDSQDLQRMMHDPDCSMKVGARLALAKRGDHEALQFYACKSLTGSIEAVGDLLSEDLRDLGGEFTVEIYRRLLDSDQRFQADMRRIQNDNSDYLMTPLSDTVPSMLHRLLPDAPIPSFSPLQLQANPEARERIKAMWRAWIDGHQAELKQMRPTAEGISFDPTSCADVVDSSTVERRLKSIAGDRAVACGSRAYGSEAAMTANKCIRKTFARRKAFYASYFLGGNALWSSEAGIAGDGKANVFLLSYDDAGASHAGLNDDVEILDNGNTVVVPCPKPIRFREAFSRNLTCITQPGNLPLSPSTTH